MVADSRPEPTQPQRSFIARFFIFLFKLILLIVVIAAGGALGVVGSNWITASNQINNNQTKRLNDLQAEVIPSISSLDNQISRVASQAEFMDGTVGSLEDDVDSLSGQVSSLTEAVAAQAELIAAQEAQVATLTEAQTGILDDLAAAQNDVEDLIESASTLRTNLSSVSSDTSTVNETLSALEGQVSSLEGSLSDLEAEVASVTVLTGTTSITPTQGAAVVAVDTAPVQVDLTLVRLLGYIARAKIHLLENDTVSAGEAIEAASSLSSNEELTTSLETALENIDSKPAASAIALDEAWNILDSLLGN